MWKCWIVSYTVVCAVCLLLLIADAVHIMVGSNINTLIMMAAGGSDLFLIAWLLSVK